MHVTEGCRREPVAIVGMACRLPGASTVPDLWDVLVSGRDAIGEIPPERFDIDGWFDRTPGAPGRISTRLGGFLKDIDRFDAGFFGISAREAVRLDPQQRLMLQVVWEAIEDAGIAADRMAGSRTSVYSGSLAAEYWDMVRAAGMYDMHAAISNSSWGLAAGRISHLLDLRGPSMGLQATCSTGLLGVHMACRDLWSGEADLALVTGANLLLGPDLYRAMSEAGILTPTADRRFGDAGSDGYVRSEGAVGLLLKPLAAARRDDDRVYATIAGTAVNSNGRGDGSMIAPAVPGQVDMLRRAYRDAGIDPSAVDYVEAHGAGTPLGDETELTALRTVLGESRPPDRACLVGTVKANIGHIEAAAGLVGLMKAALVVHHRTVPPAIGVHEPHPLLAEDNGPLAMTDRARSLSSTGRPAIAGISSFGLSGTNVHVVLTDAPAPIERPRPQTSRDTTFVLPLSARHPAALTALADDYADLVGRCTPGELIDVVHSAGIRRTHHHHRLAVAGRDASSLSSSLRAFAAGRRSAAVQTGRAADAPKVVFVFPGQGAQWAGMGRRLMADEPVFRDWLLRCDEAVRAEAGWSPADLLQAGAPLDTDDKVQPTLWAIQVALAELWQARGVRPDLVVGHSMGEVAAACVAGMLSLRDGAAVICRRSALIRETGVRGAMVAVELDGAAAATAVKEYADRVTVGVYNSAHSCVLAGDADVLEEAIAPLRADGIFCRPVKVRYASHAPNVEKVRPRLVPALADLTPAASRVAMYSTVLDRHVTGPELDAEYWMDNLRLPVRFDNGVHAALDDERATVFVEISAHPLLEAAVEDTIAQTGRPARVVTSLIRDMPESTVLATALAQAYVAGCAVDWESVNPRGSYVSLPHYRWQATRHWVSGAGGTDTALPELTTTTSRTGATGSATRPVTGLRAAMLTFAQIRRGGPVVLEDVLLPAPGPVPIALRTGLRRVDGGWRFTVHGRHGRNGVPAQWRAEVSGRARLDGAYRRRGNRSVSLDVVLGWCRERVTGPGAQGFVQLWRRPGEAVGQIDTTVAPDGVDLVSWALRAAGAAMPDKLSTVRWEPRSIGQLRWSGNSPDGPVWVHLLLPCAGEDEIGVTASLLDHRGYSVADMTDLRLGRRAGAVTTADAAAEAVPRQAREHRPGQDGVDLLHHRLIMMLGSLLNLTPQEIDANLPLPLLGVDSLLAVKLRAMLNVEFGIDLPIREALGRTTVDELAVLLNARRAAAAGAEAAS